ncbi:CopY/TcrY family copper transport repressor [Streptococcus loxodontisalivarius]|uniref:CopY/TcrY family copper transport repressor n=1 Tax=Streptococcus loxodontisalivarius TaxID=1349415 RepID=A0ABS2PRW8_9STRE|nr:CopY/TcrY family copper transport repressor [Streptococcus loxodontisalivarius]MBM7642259.1 CopY/TcrY family copper transport repressor [Streptococcus loxodontisalivarius]
MTISNAEWEIMRVVWTKQETTSSEILDVLSQKTEWTASTVKTLLRRLVDKSYLVTERVGKAFIYRPLMTEEESINRQVDQTFAKFCQQKHLSIFEHLLEEAPMTAEDIARLQALLSQKTTVSNVPCNCIKGQCTCKEHQ